MIPDHDLVALLEPVARLAEAAGRAIRAVAGDPRARAKADGSPVTAADHAAEAILLAGLPGLGGGWPILSEEAAAAGRVPELAAAPAWWCVDPLDGTKELLAGTGEHVVSIGLVVAGRPALGALYASELEETYAGAAGIAWRRLGDGAPQPIRARTPPAEGPVALVSRSHRDGAGFAKRLAAFAPSAEIAMGSALKFGRIAAGAADLYLRLGPTCEWDTAGGEAVLTAAGGRVTGLDGATPLAYGKPGFRNPGFLARGLAA